MSDHRIGSSSATAQGRTSHARDLRFAGAISAGLVSAILVGGALLAPVADWNGLTSSPQKDSDEPLKLASPPPLRVGETDTDGPTRTAASRGLGRLGLGVHHDRRSRLRRHRSGLQHARRRRRPPRRWLRRRRRRRQRQRRLDPHALRRGRRRRAATSPTPPIPNFNPDTRRRRRPGPALHARTVSTRRTRRDDRDGDGIPIATSSSTARLPTSAGDERPQGRRRRLGRRRRAQRHRGQGGHQSVRPDRCSPTWHSSTPTRTASRTPRRSARHRSAHRRQRHRHRRRRHLERR